MSLFKRKKLLHPNIHSRSFDCGSGNKEYVGGCLNLFGIQLDFDWNDKEGSWEVSCPHELDSGDIKESLHKLFYSLKDDDVYNVFSDESQFTLEEFVANNTPNKIFWADEGGQYLFSKKHVTQDMYICIKLKKKKKSKKHKGLELTQEVRIFSGTDIVYNYPGEYYGEIQLHASKGGAD